MRRISIALAAGGLVAGFLLRAWSWEWNDQLQGDVNLFALTAREFAESGSLRYPIKYEFSDRVDYCETRSVASQHPPLFPLAAGLLAKALGTDETYPLLKLLSELGGFALLALLAARGASASDSGASTALLLAAVSPMLVDFSGNGSPYAWSGLLLLVATLLVWRLRAGRALDFVLAGAVAGVAPQIHPALLAIPASLALVAMLRWRRVPPRCALAFAGVGGIVAAPWLAWNLRHFGSPFYSYNPHVLWTNLGAAQEGIYGDVVTWRWSEASWGVVASNAWDTALRSGIEMLGGILMDGGPGAFVLASLTIWSVLTTAPRKALESALPALLYLALVLPFEFRDRFVVPLLPVFYLAAGRGFAIASRSGRRSLGGLCVVTSLAWMAPAYFESPPARYYSDDAARRNANALMVPVAESLARLEDGPVLGYSRVLDGGIDAVYYHRKLLIRGMAHGRPREEHFGDLARKLARDFRVRYVWTDLFLKPEVELIFPGARTVLGNGGFFVFELPQGRDPAGVCDRTKPAAVSKPHAVRSRRSRSAARRTLPALVRGNESTRTSARGSLNPARCRRANSRSSSTVTSARAITATVTCSPQRSCGVPKTTASITAG